MPPATCSQVKANRRLSGVYDTVDQDGPNSESKASAETILNEALSSEAPIPNIITALRDHPEDVQMQWMGIEALANLSPGNAEARCEIATALGPQVICGAMLRFPADSLVQTKGCWSIANGAQDHEVSNFSLIDPAHSNQLH